MMSNKVGDKIDAKYDARWEDYRRAVKARLHPFVWCGSLLAGVIATFWNSAFLLMPAFIFVVTSLYDSLRGKQEPGMLLCPRCGKPFFGISTGQFHLIINKCVYCGLPKFQIRID
jgi:hypothetical protein